MAYTMTRRRLAMLLPAGGLAVALRTTFANAGVTDPAEATPSDIPDSLCLPREGNGDGSGNGDGNGQGNGGGDGQGDRDESTTADQECVRGPVPVTLQIAAIAVDAPIEILETVGGVMQQPSDEHHVAWYKETARLGETGNLLLAGHLNWWGVPEAVFFRLGELRAGDGLVLVAATGTAFPYTVEWVRQESSLEPPAEEVLGMTGYEAVTLITCSGEWNSGRSEYDSRTVVRARRDPDAATPAA